MAHTYSAGTRNFGFTGDEVAGNTLYGLLTFTTSPVQIGEVVAAAQGSPENADTFTVADGISIFQGITPPQDSLTLPSFVDISNAGVVGTNSYTVPDGMVYSQGYALDDSPGSSSIADLVVVTNS